VASELIVNVMRPALMLGGLAVLWAAHRTPLSTGWVMSLYLGSGVFVAACCVVYCLTALPTELTRTKAAYAVRDWVRIAGGFMSAALAVALYERIDLVVMGFIAPASEVAVYAVAARFGQTLVVAANGASAVMAPHLVEGLPDLRAGRGEKVQRLVRDTARTVLKLSLLALVAFAVLAPWLLKLFGPHYESAYVPLMLLVSGQTVCALFGPAAGIAALAGRPRIAVVAMLAGSAVNASLNLALVPRLGASGAAVATAAGMIVTSAIAWAWTRRRFDLDTSVFRAAPPPER